MGEHIAWLACGAGLASLGWVWLAQHEAIQWMKLVDRCTANMCDLYERCEHYKQVAASLQDILDGKEQPISRCIDRMSQRAGKP